MPGLLRLLMVIRKYPPGGFLTIISISRSYRNVNDEICTEINFQIPVRVCRVRKDVNPEYFFVAALSLYKNVTDAKLASCITARNLAKHRRFYKGSLRNIPG